VSAVGSALLLLVLIASHVKSWEPPGPVRAIMIVSMFLSSAIALGGWLGDTIKESSDFNQDVYMKDQVLNDMKLVIVMSRNTVLLKDKVLYVVPTADITKFQTANKSAKSKLVPDKSSDAH
jgi:hypothetical protein